MPGRRHRKYLPKYLTSREKHSPKKLRKLKSCIKKVEKKACPKSARKHGKINYSKCRVNPVAVCRAAVMGKRRKR
jgi:hypothetical protein